MKIREIMDSCWTVRPCSVFAIARSAVRLQSLIWVAGPVVDCYPLLRPNLGEQYQAIGCANTQEWLRELRNELAWGLTQLPTH
jgi:hypothetical protein